MSPGEDGLIGIPFPEHSSELLSRLNAQRRSGLLCDLTLTSRGTRYPTHRSVMAAVSLYFRRLFGAEEGAEGGEAGEGVGGSCSVCQLDCVSPDALDALLEFAYTATLTIRSSGMRDVLEGAQLLGIQCVADACRHILGETEEPASPAEDGRRATSRRKQDRRNVAKTASPTQTWRDPQPEIIKQHTPEYDLPPTPEREETPLPGAGQNGAVRSVHRVAMSNGDAHWSLVNTRTPVTQPPEDLPSEEEESRGEGQVIPHHAPLQAETAGSQGVVEGSVRKRKSQTPQQCPVCQKIIHGAGKLPRHMRTHTGEKPFQCTACGVRFTRNDKLKIHMRKHTGERPYPCPSCPARFLHSYDLKNHLSLHSGDRPYECPLCHKAFAREDHLQRHRKGHSCLEFRTRRPRRGPETHASPPHLHQPSAPASSSSSSSSASQFPFQQGPDGAAAGGHRAAMLSPGGVSYPCLLWRAAGGRRGPVHAPLTQPQWGEEEEDEENGEEEES